MKQALTCARVREPKDLGQIEPYMGRWIWPFREMDAGDWFTVHPEDKPIGGVRAAANAAGYRMGKKFSIVNDNGMIRCTCVPLDAELTAADANDERIVLIGGDGDKYLGILEPPADGGRWAWPFRTMEPGQYFHVRHDDKHPEKVRQFAHVRGGVQGFSVSVRANDPDMPGHCRVEYVDRTSAMFLRDLPYKPVADLIMRCYGVEVDDLRYTELQDHPGKSIFNPVKRLEKSRFDAFVFQNYTPTDFYVEMLEDGVRFTAIPKGTTVDAWERSLKLKEAEVDPFQ